VAPRPRNGKTKGGDSAGFCCTKSIAAEYKLPDLLAEKKLVSLEHCERNSQETKSCANIIIIIIGSARASMRDKLMTLPYYDNL